MEFVGIAWIRTHVVAHLLNCVGVEAPQFPPLHRQASPELYCTAPTLLEGSVVEEREWPSVENFVRQHRRLGCVAYDHSYLSILDAADQCAKAVDVHGFVETVGEGLTHQRVVGDL